MKMRKKEMNNANINKCLKEAIIDRDMRNCLLTKPELFLKQVGVTFKYGSAFSNTVKCKTNDNVMFGAYRP